MMACITRHIDGFRLGEIQLPEKYQQNFDVSIECPRVELRWFKLRGTSTV
jgi:hypothetical protein